MLHYELHVTNYDGASNLLGTTWWLILVWEGKGGRNITYTELHN